MSETLHAHKDKADKIQNKVIEMEHSNAILKLENELIGERLRALFTGLQNFVDHKMMDEIGFKQIHNMKSAT